jgi:hypothetical protein
MRTSQVAYVVVRLPVGGRDFFLLRVHEKWGDWSLVGGHVEPWEEGDWFAAARREAEEELEPLRFGIDFTLEPIAEAPASWGPLESRSAGGTLTNYQAAWFALVFLRDPAVCLGRLPQRDFVLVDRELAVGAAADRKITSLLRRLDAALPNGVESVPHAWEPSIAEEALRLGIHRDSRPSDQRSLGLR